MRPSTKRKIEDILRDYPKVETYIKLREEELRFPHVEGDDNVGGGKLQNVRSEKALRTLITIQEDNRLNTIRWQHDMIADRLEEAGEDTQTIIQELYFKKYPAYTLPGLVENNMLHCGRHKAYELRNNFLKELAETFGLYDF